jgi:hypothetical protein
MVLLVSLVLMAAMVVLVGGCSVMVVPVSMVAMVARRGCSAMVVMVVLV